MLRVGIIGLGAMGMPLVLDLAGAQHSPLLLTAVARQMYGEAQARGHGRDDYTSILRVLENVAGAEVRTSAEAG